MIREAPDRRPECGIQALTVLSDEVQEPRADRMSRFGYLVIPSRKVVRNLTMPHPSPHYSPQEE